MTDFEDVVVDLHLSNYATGAERNDLDQRDWIFESIHSPTNAVHLHAAQTNLLQKHAVQAKLPAALDLRKHLPPVRNQGSRPTCVAFVAAAIKEYQERQDCGFQGYMSPNFVYAHRRNKPDGGMYPRDMCNILKSIGSCCEDRFPYNPNKEPSIIPREALKEAGGYRIQGYASVQTQEGLKRALVTYGPCYISVPVYNYGWRMWAAGEKKPTRLAIHAMAVVGYNDSGFVLRNSWGKKWGDAGHTLFPYADFGMHFDLVSLVDVQGSLPVPRPQPKPKPKKKKEGKQVLCISLPCK